VTDDKVTVSVNLFDIDGPPGTVAPGCESYGFCGIQTIIMEKDQMVAGDPSVSIFVTGADLDRFTARPAHSLSGTTSQWMASVDNGIAAFPSTTLHLWEITGTPESGIVVASSTLPIDGLSMPCDRDTLGPACAAQDGTPALVDSGDNRLLDATWRDGEMWVSANALCEAVESYACPALIQIDTDSLNVLQDFTITFGAGADAFYPAIRTDEDGNLVVVVSISSPGEYVGAAVTGVLPGGSLTSYVVMKEGEMPYEPALTASFRWGDYGRVSTRRPLRSVSQYAKDDGAVGWGTISS
jgi:hypothetical protein